MTANPLVEDLDAVLALTEGLWEDLRGGRLFLTGGTGFFGCWLLESFLWANEQLGLKAEVVVLSRDPEQFVRKAPHLADHMAVRLHRGDVRTFEFSEGPFSHIIHAATDADAGLNIEQPLVMLDTIVEGTRHVLEFARDCGARRFLLTSSGAVYGRQPAEMSHVTEDYPGAPNPMGAAASYGEGKRLAELLCAVYTRQCGFEAVIARCFAFVGPYLPLDGHYAAGNFLGNGLRGEPIHIGGDGTPRRSYLYASDLAVWLWTLLFRGQSCRPYNVGSEDDLSIADLAHQMAEQFGGLPVEIAKMPESGRSPERYVPATKRAQMELKLRQTVMLPEALSKTIRWHQENSR